MNLYRLPNGKFAMRDDGKMMEAPTYSQFEECCCDFIWRLKPCYHFREHSTCPGITEETPELYTDQNMGLWKDKTILWNGVCYEVTGPFLPEVFEEATLLEVAVTPDHVYDDCESCCTCPCPLDVDDEQWDYLLVDIPALTDYARCANAWHLNPSFPYYETEWEWPEQTLLFKRTGVCNWYNTSAHTEPEDRMVGRVRYRQWQRADCTGWVSPSEGWHEWEDVLGYCRLTWISRDYYEDYRYDCCWDLHVRLNYIYSAIFGNRFTDSPLGWYPPSQGAVTLDGWGGISNPDFEFPEVQPGMYVYQLP